MHLSHIDDAEAFESVDGGTIRELAGRVSLPAQRQSLAEATIPAGGATDEHYHPVAEEIYFFQTGAGRLRIDGEERDVRAGDCAVIPPGSSHKLFNAGDEPLALLCCCSPPWSADDTVLTGG
ncbi:MAG TPA: cupin domain-containing protein [Solirubrobacteraceae bacterium]|jgi:mannose-6-phosphate isomerase-like protein (cupin superfamily)|nr:cupin domain-containing protein [Solirubrobacteraceae bacterium]